MLNTIKKNRHLLIVGGRLLLLFLLLLGLLPVVVGQVAIGAVQRRIRRGVQVVVGRLRLAFLVLLLLLLVDTVGLGRLLERRQTHGLLHDVNVLARRLARLVELETILDLLLEAVAVDAGRGFCGRNNYD